MIEYLFDPDQPRDDRGRFGSGGGGSAPAEKSRGLHSTAKEANKWAAEHVKASSEHTESEKEALQSYRRNGYKDINGSLRGQRELTGERKQKAEENIRQLDSVMAKTVVDEAVTVRRGIGVDPEKAADVFPVGGSVTDSGFMSTTVAESVSENFGLVETRGGYGQTIFEIEVPAGTRAAYIGNRGEAELLLDRGTALEIVSVTRQDRGLRKVSIVRARVASQRTLARMSHIWLRDREEDDTPEDDFMDRFDWQPEDIIITPRRRSRS